MGKMASHKLRSATSRSSKGKPVRVVHIGNPKVVKASPSEFRAVVQSLTGKKSSSSSSATHHHNLSSSSSPQGIKWDCDENRQVKVLKLNESESNFNNRDGQVTSQIQETEMHDIFTNIFHTFIDGSLPTDFLSIDGTTNTSVKVSKI